MKWYRVHILINGKEWGEYEVYSVNRESAAFKAGMRFFREEVSGTSHTGDAFSCNAVPLNIDLAVAAGLDRVPIA